MSAEVKVSYAKLWKLLVDGEMKKKYLQAKVKVGSAVIVKMGREECVNLETLGKICYALHCDLGDVADIISGEENA